ncbi:hypothetical protein [Candidatus Nitrososphaera evergladensis]|uniref:hypothetical protein n=1 Tax=Candidatus Nitrososphaera evergladensis TaxID=1459637 RepID=UPI0011E59E4A|nr:hypothetical protein [Candidatus Nitrososphaera evergladensis]
MWVENGLIQKLIEAHAVEKYQTDIAFTKTFQRFVARQRAKITKEQTLEDWRLILGAYDYKLVNLTADEAGATMVLLEFFADNTKKKTAIPDGR